MRFGNLYHSRQVFARGFNENSEDVKSWIEGVVLLFEDGQIGQYITRRMQKVVKISPQDQTRNSLDVEGSKSQKYDQVKNRRYISLVECA